SKSTISGFGFWVDNNVFGSEFGDLRFEQVWLTIEQTIIDTMAKDTTIAVMVLAPQGQAKQVHDLRVHVLHPFSGMPWVSELIVGKHIPPFGREWPSIRVDRVGTVRYSGLSDSLVARDNGFQLKTRLRSFNGSLALLLGDRIGGYARERDNTHRHFYFRGRYDLPYHVVAGASYRWSTLDHKPWALELTREVKRSLCAFELLRVEDITQWYVLVEHDVVRHTPIVGGRTRVVARFEKLRYGERTVIGCLLHPFKGITIKVNCIDDRFKTRTEKKVLTQAIIHFSP
ncbi:hypothetical protein KKF64_02475, partial [Patescibacteria group bacterium]|nr:hypothetical protein [Patescibacteria group bacterium]